MWRWLLPRKLEITHRFKHLVFLQLQRLQPSPSVLDAFFLEIIRSSVVQLSLENKLHARAHREREGTKVDDENYHINMPFLLGAWWAEVLKIASVLWTKSPLIVWSYLMFWWLQVIKRFHVVKRLRSGRACSKWSLSLEHSISRS